MKHVAAVISRLPWPLTDGESVRRFEMLRALSSLVRLDVLAVRRVDTTEADELELVRRLDLARVQFFDANPLQLWEPAGTVLRWLRGAAYQTPPWIGQEFSASLEKYLASHSGNYSSILFCGESTALYTDVADCSVRRIWDKSNVVGHSLREERRLARSSKDFIRAALSCWLGVRYEARYVGAMLHVIVTSEEDYRRFAQLYPGTACSVLKSCGSAPPGHCVPDFDSRVLGWLGLLDYSANAHGLKRFIKTGLPMLRRRGFSLRVVGATSDASFARELRSASGIEYMGYQEDLAGAFTGVRCGIVPLWYGAGVKLKVVSMMALGMPIVATSVGAEGIPRDVFVAVDDDPIGLAEAACTAPVELLTRAASEGRLAYVESFSPTALSQSVSRFVQDVL